MQKLFHVFVSSTYSDLRDERRRVSEAVAKAGYVPEGMELFPASSKKQLEFIKRVIDRCDYYVVILGGRYGSLADDNVSYTEQEYRYALERGVPTLAFLHSSPDKIEVGKVERDPANAERLAAFRDRLKSSAMVDFWDNADALATAVVVALGQEITLSPGIGWVRGDQAFDPRIAEELSNAKARIAELESALGNNDGDAPVTFPKTLAPVEEQFAATLYVQEYEKGEEPKRERYAIKDYEVVVAVSWKDLFLRCAPGIYRGDTETSIANAVFAGLVRSEVGPAPDRVFRDITGRLNALQLRYQFEALGLITTEHRVRQRSLGLAHTTDIIWALTEKGRRYIALARAWRTNTEDAAED
jgi:hypothetical protein